MQVDSKESKKQKKEVLFEGGDDGEDNQPKSRTDRKLDKYSDDINAYKEGIDKDKFNSGIERDRGVTDCFCGLAFIGFCITMCILLGWTISQGRTDLLFAPVSFVNIKTDGAWEMMDRTDAIKKGSVHYCGIPPENEGDLDFGDFPWLYIVDLSPLSVINADEIMDQGICVKECPTQNMTAKDLKDIAFGKKELLDDLDFDGLNPDGAYKSKKFKPLRLCLPDVDDIGTTHSAVANEVKKVLVKLSEGSAGKYVFDLYLSSTSIFYSMGTSFVWSIVCIYFLSLFAEYVAWAIVFVVQIGLIGGAAVSGGMWVDATSEDASQDELGKANMYMFAAVIFAILGAIFLCMICFGYNQLKTAIDVLDASADFLAKTKRIFIIPTLYMIVQIMFVVAFLYAMLAIGATGEIKPIAYQLKETDLDNVEEGKGNRLFYIAVFQFFGLLWILNFIVAKTNFITMVAASTYYFDSNSEKEGDGEVMTGVRFAYLNHFGSLAIGSFIIACCQFVRFVFEYLAEKAQRASGDNTAIKVIICIGDCILRCIEKICDYITKSAYAYMAITGENFCSSAWNGFLLQMSYGLEFVWANTLATIFIFLGKVFIVVLNCFTLLFFMKLRHDDEEVTSKGGPLLVCIVASYFTANLFLGIMDEAVLALLTCLCIDKGINDGEPKYGPPTFHDGASKIPSGPQKKGDKYEKVTEMV